MLSEGELVQMTAPEVREKLDNEELVSLGIFLEHYVVPETTEYECDSHLGYLRCECGWESKTMSASAWRQRVQEHLEEIVGRRFDADGGEKV